MANEFKLSYTGKEINDKLGMIEQLSEEIVDLHNLEDTTNAVYINGWTQGSIYNGTFRIW